MKSPNLGPLLVRQTLNYLPKNFERVLAANGGIIKLTAGILNYYFKKPKYAFNFFTEKKGSEVTSRGLGLRHRLFFSCIFTPQFVKFYLFGLSVRYFFSDK